VDEIFPINRNDTNLCYLLFGVGPNNLKMSKSDPLESKTVPSPPPLSTHFSQEKSIFNFLRISDYYFWVKECLPSPPPSTKRPH